MKPSYIIILLMVAIFVVSFGSGYALCLIDKKNQMGSAVP